MLELVVDYDATDYASANLYIIDKILLCHFTFRNFKKIFI